MNRAEKTEGEKISRAVIEDRKTLSLTGIENIVSFDESFIVLDAGDCLVTVDGEGLQMLKMDTDSREVAVAGKINGLVYSDKRQGSKRLGGFFRGGKRQ